MRFQIATDRGPSDRFDRELLVRTTEEEGVKIKAGLINIQLHIQEKDGLRVGAGMTLDKSQAKDLRDALSLYVDDIDKEFDELREKIAREVNGEEPV